jgi:hypothetical protein
MFPFVFIAGLLILLLVLFAAAMFIAIPGAARRPKPEPVFATEFIDELNRLREPEAAPGRAVSPVPDEPHGLYQRGEPAFRIAAKLGIPRADAELLIRIESALQSQNEPGS